VTPSGKFAAGSAVDPLAQLFLDQSLQNRNHRLIL
jgi:hypothetical protein